MIWKNYLLLIPILVKYKLNETDEPTESPSGLDEKISACFLVLIKSNIKPL